jgi:hypothetical protein
MLSPKVRAVISAPLGSAPAADELKGEVFRPLSLGERKKRLAQLLARVTPGIALCDHTDAAGELVFRQACAMGLEGIVSKRLAAPYLAPRGIGSRSRTRTARRCCDLASKEARHVPVAKAAKS